MSEFKVGDVVLRTGVDFDGVEEGQTYTIKSIDVDGFFSLEGVREWYDAPFSPCGFSKVKKSSENPMVEDIMKLRKKYSDKIEKIDKIEELLGEVLSE